MKSHGWALQNPDGTVNAWTFRPIRNEAWAEAFALMDPQFQNKYWHRWEPSIRAAARLGYRVVRVNLTLAKER